MSVAIATFFINYADEVAGFSDAKSSNLLSVAQGIFTVGRFFATLCMTRIEAKYILTTFIAILIAVSAMASRIGGVPGIGLYILLFFFERYFAVVWELTLYTASVFRLSLRSGLLAWGDIRSVAQGLLSKPLSVERVSLL